MESTKSDTDFITNLDELDLDVMDLTLKNILARKSLKWIFVGGKGGVGKTTCSSALAVQLAKYRDSVLIISTDPAHNLSDAFAQKFTKKPTLIHGFKNLYGMEIDPTIEEEEKDVLGGNQESKIFQDLAASIPGIDEAMSFAEVMKQVQTMEFQTILFDTAPTGHTLRLLSFPSVLEKGIGKILSLKSKFGFIFQQLSSMLGPGMENEESMMGKLEQTKKVIEEVNAQFANPDLTTFICVCIPEFLSLYETERLIQELAKFRIDTDNIIVNQVLYPERESGCKLCLARGNIQKKYLDQIDDLYPDFHIVKLPLQPHEIRGVESIQEFSKLLFSPYQPK